MSWHLCGWREIDYLTPRMIRVLHLVSPRADFQTDRAIAHLSKDLSSGFESDVCAMQRNARYRNVFTSTLSLRRKSSSFDVVHAWGMAALTAAALGAWGRIVFCP